MEIEKSFKSWVELIRDVRSGQFWWSLALLVSFADLYLVVRFETGLLGWMNTVPGFFEIQFTGAKVTEVLYFIALVALAWFYLLRVLVVPLWQKAMFELNWRLSIDYRRLPSRHAGWRYLSDVKRRAAVNGNAVLYAHCTARQREIDELRHQLTCALGIVLFSLMAAMADTNGGCSLGGAAMVAWQTSAKVWQFVLMIAALPGGMLLCTILLAEWECLAHCIKMPDDYQG